MYAVDSVRSPFLAMHCLPGHKCLPYQGGETAYENIPAGGSKEAMDMAFSIRECSPEDYGLVLNSSGTEYIDAESETQALLPASEDEEFEM